MKLARTIILLIMLSGFVSASYAGGHLSGDKKDRAISKTADNDKYDFISINNILMWISNNGSTAHNPLTDASGLEWPKGSGMYAIFQDGIIWGGKIAGDVRVNGSAYRQGLQAGIIKPDGTADSPADPRFRIYKVRKIDEAGYEKLTSTEQTRMKKDFEEWPWKDGAPWVDKNKNGVYEPDFTDWLAKGDASTFDTPWFIGDEVLWFVSNDMDSKRSSNTYGTSPIGLEVLTLVWGYEQTGPLGNMVFTKYTLINKGTDDLEEAYIAKWSDPDLGDANDDYVGIDTTLVLGYVYNGTAKDGVYGIPPAAGYDFFQGPIVPGDPTDVAHYNFGLRQGYKNLGVSSFAFYINSSTVYSDPEQGTTQGAQQFYYYLQGLLWTGAPFIDPTTGLETKVTLAGDPVKKTGWIDGIVETPGDRRLVISTGPFTLAKGDTQEVVVASIVGRGSDRISSIEVLKYYDRFAQLAFDNNFDLPKAPPSPDVKASRQPGKIILHWGDQKNSDIIENFVDRGYKFQGYNVYQFPGKGSTLADGKRIATFDLVDNIATIFDEVIDERSGAVVILPVQFGTDSGIRRVLEMTNDAIIDRPLVNNQPYYFAVTTYSYNEDPDITPRQLESTPRIIEVRPQGPDPGISYGAQYAEKLTVEHPHGISTGKVEVQVIDPNLLTGDTYEVSFLSLGTIEVEYDHDHSGDITDHPLDTLLHVDNIGEWNLRNIRTDNILLNRNRSFTGLATGAYVVDGFMIGVTGSPHYEEGHEILSDEWFGGPRVYQYVNPLTAGYEFFGSSIPGYLVTKTVEIRFNEDSTSKGYNYLRLGTPGYGYQGYFDSKVTVWDVTDRNNHKKISYAFVENAGDPAQNQTWSPRYGGLGGREYFFIIDEPYSDVPNPKYTDPFRISVNADDMPILYAFWVEQNQDYGKEPPWKNGDKWVITPNVAFSTNDKYTFTTPKRTYERKIAQDDVSKINVFPNPYLGTNAQELNKYQRFVTFNHLPQRANFKIYSLSGTLVRSFSKNDPSQVINWDLQNDNQLPVGSGIYIIHIELPDLGVEKILKLGVVAEAQFLDRI